MRKGNFTECVHLSSYPIVNHQGNSGRIAIVFKIEDNNRQLIRLTQIYLLLIFLFVFPYYITMIHGTNEIYNKEHTAPVDSKK
jgi:hypothetical protein